MKPNALGEDSDREREMNPFLKPYQTKHNIPAFELIKIDHILPAFEKGIEEQDREVNEIESNPEKATFSNTIEALEKSGKILKRVSAYFYNVLGSHTNDALNALAETISPKMAAHRDRIFLSQTLFSRVESLQEHEKTLNPEQTRMLEELIQRFRQAGVQLKVADKKRLEDINRRLAGLSVKYQQNMLQESNKTYVFLESEAELEGLPESVIAQGREMAKSEGKDKGWMFKATCQHVPFLTHSKNKMRRRELYSGYINRGSNDNQWDNRPIAQESANLRLEKATLLWRNHAEYTLKQTMAKTPKRVLSLLDAVWEPALALAKQEAEELQQIIDRRFWQRLTGADWRYYAEKCAKKIRCLRFGNQALFPIGPRTFRGI